MDINVGDFICVPEYSVARTEDGWLDGLNISNGAVGFFPLNHVMRVAESDSWSLHHSLVIHSPYGERARIERSMVEPQRLTIPLSMSEPRQSSDESSRATHEKRMCTFYVYYVNL